MLSERLGLSAEASGLCICVAVYTGAHAKAVSWVFVFCGLGSVFSSFLGLVLQVSPQINLQLFEQTFTEAA